MSKILSYRFTLFFSLLILFAVFILNTIPPLNWGYDEFGTIVSHLELDNLAFKEIYRENLVNIGITKSWILDFILDIVMPIIVVPLRWTYAIGISPILGFSRFIDLEWPILGFVLLVPYIFFAILGAYLVALSITKNGGHQNIFLFFLSFVLLSHPFLKWTLTLTSYSHHLFCFGLLLYSETQFKETNNIFSKLTFSRSIVQLFNYQYIVIFAAIGLYQVIINFKVFFKNKIYLNWILPFSIALASIGFLYLRGLVSGKHTNPAYATNVEIYNFSVNTNSFISSAHYTITRLIDFLYYFFIESKSFYGGPNDISTSFIGSFIFILIIISIYFIILKKINTNIKRILLLLLFSLLAPYLLSFQPFVATRHSLVLFLPVALIFAFTASILLESFLKKKYVKLGSFLLLLFSAYNAVGFNTSKSVSLNIEKITPILSQYSINQIILSPCDYEPLLYNDIRNVYKVLYRCGPKFVNKVGPSEERIAILSKNDISVSDARKIISDFSVNDWVLTDDFINCNIKMVDKDLCMSSVHIFNKVIKSD